jgi:hypothetical protein
MTLPLNRSEENLAAGYLQLLIQHTTNNAQVQVQAPSMHKQPQAQAQAQGPELKLDLIANCYLKFIANDKWRAMAPWAMGHGFGFGAVCSVRVRWQ